MADWQRTIRLPEWQRVLMEEMTIQQLAAIISSRIRALDDIHRAEIDYMRDQIAIKFDRLSVTKTTWPNHALNDLMNDLWDWGDIALDDRRHGRKVCWIDIHCTEENAE